MFKKIARIKENEVIGQKLIFNKIFWFWQSLQKCKSYVHENLVIKFYSSSEG